MCCLFVLVPPATLSLKRMHECGSTWHMNERQTIKTLNLSKHRQVLGAKEQHCLMDDALTVLRKKRSPCCLTPPCPYGDGCIPLAQARYYYYIYYYGCRS
jgi:hypothetical protein